MSDPGTRDTLPEYLRDHEVRILRLEHRPQGMRWPPGKEAGKVLGFDEEGNPAWVDQWPPGAGPDDVLGVTFDANGEPVQVWVDHYPLGGSLGEVLTSIGSNSDGTTNVDWLPSGGGIAWPIQTADPPLDVGANLNTQNEELEAFVQLDKRERLLDPSDQRSLPRYVQFHPLSKFGPMWTCCSGGVNPDGSTAAWLRDVNPDGEISLIETWWNGEMQLWPADNQYYGTTPGREAVDPAAGVYVPWDQIRDYNMDVYWNFDHHRLGAGFELEHYQDIIRAYDGDFGQVWDGAAADLWLGTGGYFELFADAWGEIPDFEALGGIHGTSPQTNPLSGPPMPTEIVIWSELRQDFPTTPVTSSQELMETRFNSRLMRVFDGPTNSGLPDGQLCRGTISVLATASDVLGSPDDPTRKQYFRQIGQDTVAFSAGVGTITFPEETGVHRHPQAVVVGTTVGGPRVAQVATTGNTMTCYLDITHTGSLAVSWSIEYEEPDWSQTRPVAGYLRVAGVEGTAQGTYYFLQSGTPQIPWSAAGEDLNILINGENFVVGLTIRDHTDTARGTLTSVGSVPNGQDSLNWTIQRDWYAVGQSETFHIRNPDGQRSNYWTMQWADIPLPT